MSMVPIELIVGLGNPGQAYQATRHNAGFCLLDQLAQQTGTTFKQENKYKALVTHTHLANQSVWLLKPQTYMNRSGLSVGAIAHFYKIQPEAILVVHDELDLAPGVAKLKKGGSSAGHNGLKDITAALGSPEYWRLRLGIGHPRQLGRSEAVADFVLHRPTQQEEWAIKSAIEKSLSILPLLVQAQFNQAMMQLHP